MAVAATAGFITFWYAALPASARKLFSTLSSTQVQAYGKPRSQLLVLTAASTNANSKDLYIQDVTPTVLPFEILSVRVTYVATSTAGNRAVKMDLMASDDTVLFSTPSSLTITASQTKVLQFARGVATATIGGVTYDPLAESIIGFEDQKIRIYDSGGIDELDDMSIVITGRTVV